MERDHYQTVHRDGRKLAVINADEMEDGIILVPGTQYSTLIVQYSTVQYSTVNTQSVRFLIT